MPKPVEGRLQEVVHERYGKSQEATYAQPWLERLDKLMDENLSKLNDKFTTSKDGFLKCRGTSSIS